MTETVLFFNEHEEWAFDRITCDLRLCGLVFQSCKNLRILCENVNFGELISPKLILAHFKISQEEIETFGRHNRVRVAIVPSNRFHFRFIITQFELEKYLK